MKKQVKRYVTLIGSIVAILVLIIAITKKADVDQYEYVTEKQEMLETSINDKDMRIELLKQLKKEGLSEKEATLDSLINQLEQYNAQSRLLLKRLEELNKLDPTELDALIQEIGKHLNNGKSKSINTSNVISKLIESDNVEAKRNLDTLKALNANLKIDISNEREQILKLESERSHKIRSLDSLRISVETLFAAQQEKTELISELKEKILRKNALIDSARDQLSKRLPVNIVSFNLVNAIQSFDPADNSFVVSAKKIKGELKVAIKLNNNNYEHSFVNDKIEFVVVYINGSASKTFTMDLPVILGEASMYPLINGNEKLRVGFYTINMWYNTGGERSLLYETNVKIVR